MCPQSTPNISKWWYNTFYWNSTNYNSYYTFQSSKDIVWDPLIVWSWNYKLQNSSPCIDSGTWTALSRWLNIKSALNSWVLDSWIVDRWYHW